jgi:hypothetical protein
MASWRGWCCCCCQEQNIIFFSFMKSGNCNVPLEKIFLADKHEYCSVICFSICSSLCCTRRVPGLFAPMVHWAGLGLRYYSILEFYMASQ